MGASHSVPTPDVDDVQSFDQLPSARTATGEDFDFKSTRDKVTLSRQRGERLRAHDEKLCGFRSLCRTIRRRSVILAFPCNQFLFQESGSSKSICAFAQKRGFKGTVFEKVQGEREGGVARVSLAEARAAREARAVEFREVFSG